MTPETTGATVTIHALTVDGNHMPRPVWEQVPHRPLLTRDGELDGTPWGTVNLHTDCDSPAGHIHVAYTNAGSLYQDAVSLHLVHPPAVSEAGELLFQRVVSSELRGHQVPYLTGQHHTEHGVSYEFTQTKELALVLKAHQVLGKEQAALTKIYRDQERYGGATKRITKQESTVAHAKDVFTRALAALDATLAEAPPIETLYEQFTTEARIEATRRELLARTIDDLKALPQLYILGGAT